MTSHSSLGVKKCSCLPERTLLSSSSQGDSPAFGSSYCSITCKDTHAHDMSTSRLP